MSNSNYGNSSISQLEGAKRIRTRPESLLGSKGLAGAKHTIYEIIGNSSDEQLSGHGDQLDISVYSDGAISVRDYGRGVPLGWNPEYRKWNYFLVYEELWAGGKYDDAQEILRAIEDWDNFRLEDHNYLIAVGLNGVGAAATQYTSEYMEVKSYREGKCHYMRYEKGVHSLKELVVTDLENPEETGTYVKWNPDPEVFTEARIPEAWIKKLARDLSYTAGFRVVFTAIDGEVTVFEKKEMLDELVESVGSGALGKLFTHTVDSEADVCVCWSDVVIGPAGRGQEYFHNKVGVKGGVHSEAVYTAMSDFLLPLGREHGVRITSADYSGKFSVIVSSLSNKVSYRGATKDSLDNTYVYANIRDNLLGLLQTEYAKKTTWLVQIIDEVVTNAKNRVAVAELTKNLKEFNKVTKKLPVSEKLITSTNYPSPNCEYWIFEGDSAGDAFKLARDRMFQCLYKIRGKSLNLYKCTIEQLLANKEVRDIISSLGCGVELGLEGYQSFDITKLKVGKIIFCSDADVDGLHIRMLLFVMFYRLFPELLYEGLVYIAETPRFSIITTSGEVIYCKDNEELEELKKTTSIKEIGRFKGLGEMNPDQLWNTTANPETRQLVQLKIDRDDSEVLSTLDCLFGKSTDRRKKAILGSMLGSVDTYDELVESIEDTIARIEDMDLSEVEYEVVSY